jgi:hypothetical protein
MRSDPTGFAAWDIQQSILRLLGSWGRWWF